MLQQVLQKTDVGGDPLHPEFAKRPVGARQQLAEISRRPGDDQLGQQRIVGPGDLVAGVAQRIHAQTRPRGRVKYGQRTARGEHTAVGLLPFGVDPDLQRYTALPDVIHAQLRQLGAAGDL